MNYDVFIIYYYDTSQIKFVSMTIDIVWRKVL